jgi:hypothetical protein
MTASLSTRVSHEGRYKSGEVLMGAVGEMHATSDPTNNASSDGSREASEAWGCSPHGRQGHCPEVRNSRSLQHASNCCILSAPMQLPRPLCPLASGHHPVPGGAQDRPPWHCHLSWDAAMFPVRTARHENIRYWASCVAVCLPVIDSRGRRPCPERLPDGLS